eukprot:5186709-Pleurochrysis_carterae.AAC.1
MASSAVCADPANCDSATAPWSTTKAVRPCTPHAAAQRASRTRSCECDSAKSVLPRTLSKSTSNRPSAAASAESLSDMRGGGTCACCGAVAGLLARETPLARMCGSALWVATKDTRPFGAMLLNAATEHACKHIASTTANNRSGR